MSVWLKAAIYSLAGAVLGSILIGMLFTNTGTMNGLGSGAFGGPGQGSYGGLNDSFGYANVYPQGGYISAAKMGMGTNRGRCMNGR